MSNNENEFRKILLESAKADKSIHVVDIPDEIKRVLHLHPELARYIQEKPYDLGLLKGGKYVGLELKNESKHLTWNISEVRDHQIKYLKEVNKCGGRGLVLVRFKRAVDLKEKARLKIPKNKWAIDFTFVLDIMALTKCKQRSFPIEYLAENFPVMELDPYTKKYDLEVLWKKTSPKKP